MAFPDITYGKPLTILELDGVKSLLNITGTTYDAQLTAAMPIVTGMMETHCQRGLAQDEEAVQEFVGYPKRVPLFRFPVTELLQMSLNGELMDPTALPKFDRWGFINMSSAGDQTLIVSYKAGFAPGDVPPDLAQAFARCVADYAGVPYVATAASGGAPLKSLSLGSGALAVSFDTGNASVYEAGAVPPLLQPYYFTLERYRMKEYV